MKSCSIVIVSFNNRRDDAETWRKRMASSWRPPSPPNVTIIDAEDWKYDAPVPDAVITPVFCADDHRAFTEWLSRCGAARMSIIAIGNESTVGTLPAAHPSVLPIQAEHGEEIIFAMLRGVLHRSSITRDLQRELCLVERFHGGLESQLSQVHEELQLAAMVQREFLPSSLPSLYGVECGVLWRPAHYVSGDIYEVTRLDHDHLGVFIADAVGHGVPAALMTMVIARSLTLFDEQHPDRRLLAPGEVLSRLNNRLICHRDGSTRFATGVYALVDCRSRTMKVAGAGHPAPLHARNDGTVTSLTTEGGLLGIFPDEIYTEVEVELELDDRVLFYSDGFEVAFPTATCDRYEQHLPTKRYRDEFSEMLACQTPAMMIEHIQKRIDAQRGSLHQVDDLTLICLQAGAINTTPPVTSASAAGMGRVSSSVQNGSEMLT
jgi:phosphoserine phosphatase RsbU/P